VLESRLAGRTAMVVFNASATGADGCTIMVRSDDIAPPLQPPSPGNGSWIRSRMPAISALKA
jgi:hypothetical protein